MNRSLSLDPSHTTLSTQDLGRHTLLLAQKEICGTGTLGTPYRHTSIMVANSTARVMAIGALVCRNRFHLSAPDAGKRMQCSKVNIMFRSCAALIGRQLPQTSGINRLMVTVLRASHALNLVTHTTLDATPHQQHAPSPCRISGPHETVDSKIFQTPYGFVEYSSEQVSSVLDAKTLQHFTLKSTKSINMITSTFVFLGLVASTVLAHPVQRDLGDFDDLVVRDAGADTSVYDIIKTRELSDLTTRDVGADTSVYDLVHAREYLDERDENDFEERDYDELEGRDYEEFEERDYEDFEERDYDDLEDRDIDDFLHYARLVARKGGRGGGGGSRSAPKPAPPPKAPTAPPKAPPKPAAPPKAPPKPAAPPKQPPKPASPPKTPPKPASPPKTPPKPASPPKTPPKPASPPKNPPKPAAPPKQPPKPASPPKQPPKPASPPKTPPKAPAPPKQPPKPASPPKTPPKQPSPPKQPTPPARPPIDPNPIIQSIPQYIDPFVQIWMQQQQQQTQQEQIEEWQMMPPMEPMQPIA
ncbi:hypothetical protein CCMSSC00406_0006015 [Pleurotus cornucopiae]|uniref:Uncharacterized protein n=1 Tax=Pleurotus cornucopiae TaxID=5321 RepID=A0ACB7IPX2_PLECO|nr:hypothetical protein CCMSSC00406_0006015 [Pleurotus cornucopiae]